MIGAIREWINSGTGRVVVGIVTAVIVIVVAVVVYKALTGGRESEITRVHSFGRPAPMLCKGCGYAAEVEVSRQQEFPMACPKCDSKQLIEGVKCLGRGCRKIFEAPASLVYRCLGCGYYYDDREPGGGDPDMVPKPPEE